MKAHIVGYTLAQSSWRRYREPGLVPKQFATPKAFGVAGTRGACAPRKAVAQSLIYRPRRALLDKHRVDWNERTNEFHHRRCVLDFEAAAASTDFGRFQFADLHKFAVFP